MDYEKKYKEDFETFAKAYMEENDANIISFYDRYVGLVDGVRWVIEKTCKWLEDEFTYPTMTQEEINWYKDKVNEFRKAMEL